MLNKLFIKYRQEKLKKENRKYNTNLILERIHKANYIKFYISGLTNYWLTDNGVKATYYSKENNGFFVDGIELSNKEIDVIFLINSIDLKRSFLDYSNNEKIEDERISKVINLGLKV